MIKVCILIPWFCPAYKAGGPIQSIANMVEQFSENISYEIICSNTDLGGEILNVLPDQWIDLAANTKVCYVSNKKTPISFFKNEVKKNKEILFINGIYSWRFNLAPLLFYKASTKIVSARGMLHPGALSEKSFKKNIYIFFWKIFRLHKKCDFHASNEDEKKYIEKTFGRGVKVFVAQNFPRVLAKQPVLNKVKGSLNLISIALISPMKNHLLILNALAFCKGNIVYDIYGPVKDATYWNLCLEKIKNLPKNISVNYHRDIPPAQVEISLINSHVFILPSKSENFGHAIYEALSIGRPVITSHNTPWQKLEEQNAGKNISPENIQEVANAIDEFTAMSEDEFVKWNMGAHQYAMNAIDIKAIKEQYKKMFFAN